MTLGEAKEVVLEACEEGALANVSHAADWSSNMGRRADQCI